VASRSTSDEVIWTSGISVSFAHLSSTSPRRPFMVLAFTASA